jgi:hypothetical protein
MQTQLIIEAQIRQRPDGTVAVLGESGHIVFGGMYADVVWADYQKLLQSEPARIQLGVLIDVDVMKPY